MHHRPKLNGWQRLWIVGSVLAFLYTAGWAFIEGARAGGQHIEQKVIDGFSNPACAEVIKMPAVSKLNPEPGLDHPCWELYLYRSIYDNAAVTADGYRKDIGARRLDWQVKLAGLALVLWVAGCGLVYAAGWVAAWVRRGFARDSRPT